MKKVFLSLSDKVKINLEKNDPLHLIHVNVLWAMIEFPEDTIITMTWVRAEYILSLQDKDWKIHE